MQFFSDISLQHIAFQCAFMKRIRNIEPHVLILSLIAALSTGKITSIAQLHQKFMACALIKSNKSVTAPFITSSVKRLLSNLSKYWSDLPWRNG
ncbi:hypothetical protein XNC1_3013 [Xenorhabdus nematophila ATCC 19061]|uniref:Uncharacterized protein n=1 Tax=Xenorhabdus nematophila (strain ATCC 19061 / DSM 3370 / CCUG 14189 / LMG 1036 / NCIMB 9965 / AN6) TaxID=406817 RepID=D3VK08_XENNA|nr:hypothetical protein XNC1_3013 [Xenorhabdus nematophila ATCC 19061]